MRYITTVALAVVIGQAISSAQELRFHREYPIPERKLLLGSSQSLVIECSGIRDSDIISISLRNESTFRGVLVTPASGFPPLPGPIMEIPESWYGLREGILKLSRPKGESEDKILLLHITLPPETYINMTVDGKAMMKGKLNSNLSYRRGSIGQGFNSFGESLTAATFGDFPRFNKVLPPARAGAPYIVPFQLVKPKIERLIMPKASGKSGRVTAAITINKQGGVAEVRTFGDQDPELISAVNLAVRQWSFKPLGLNSEALTLVTFLFSGEGVNIPE